LLITEKEREVGRKGACLYRNSFSKGGWVIAQGERSIEGRENSHSPQQEKRKDYRCMRRAEIITARKNGRGRGIKAPKRELSLPQRASLGSFWRVA